MFEKCKTQLALWMASAKTRRDLRKLATKIENGGNDWFTAVLHPEVPLDNNEAERSIRPWRVMEKIMGCLRSDAGIRTHEVLMSLVSTWEKQHKDVFSTLQATFSLIDTNYTISLSDFAKRPMIAYQAGIFENELFFQIVSAS